MHLWMTPPRGPGAPTPSLFAISLPLYPQSGETQQMTHFCHTHSTTLSIFASFCNLQCLSEVLRQTLRTHFPHKVSDFVHYIRSL